MRWLRCTLVDDDRDIDMTVDVLVDEQDRVRPGLSYFGTSMPSMEYAIGGIIDSI